jgi:hypothetical protein
MDAQSALPNPDQTIRGRGRTKTDRDLPRCAPRAAWGQRWASGKQILRNDWRTLRGCLETNWGTLRVEVYLLSWGCGFTWFWLTMVRETVSVTRTKQ